MRRLVAACVIPLMFALPVRAAECQQDSIRHVTRMSPGTAPFVMAAVPVVETIAGKRFILLDGNLLDRNPWRAGDKVSLCRDEEWPGFIAVTNLTRAAVLYFLASRD